MRKMDRIRAGVEYIRATCDINAEVDSRLQSLLAVLAEPEVADVVASKRARRPAPEADEA